jgi:hypothetical protein
MQEAEAKEFIDYFKGAQESQPLYQRQLLKLLRFYDYGKPLLDDWMADNRGGIKAATKPVLDILYYAWLRTDKLANSPALQTLASQGRLRTLDIDKTKKTELQLPVAVLVNRFHSPPPKVWTTDTIHSLPAGFRVRWNVVPAGGHDFVFPAGVWLADVCELPDGFEASVVEELGKLAVVADDAEYTESDGQRIWNQGRAAAVGGRRNHVLVLFYYTGGTYSIIGFLWQTWTNVQYTDCEKGHFPTVEAYAVYPGYSRLGFGLAMLFFLLRLQDIAARAHLCMRVHQHNAASLLCLEKVGEKVGRTLHKVGVVGHSGTTFRVIQEEDDMLQCCLSVGEATIFPTPTRLPGPKRQRGRKKAKMILGG